MTAAGGDPGETHETPPDPAYGPAPVYPPPQGYAPPPPPLDYPSYPGYPGYPGYPPPPPAGTNTLAAVALVSSVLGLLCGIGSILGITLGLVAISQIKKTGQRGHALAVSAIVVGVASLVLSIIMWTYARNIT